MRHYSMYSTICKHWLEEDDCVCGTAVCGLGSGRRLSVCVCFRLMQSLLCLLQHMVEAHWILLLVIYSPQTKTDE